MLKKIILAVIVLGAVLPASSQTAPLPVYYCTHGGVQSKTSGLSSTNYMQGIVPKCTVTVYLTGTTTLATTTPSTPLTANSDGSIPPIYAPIGYGYDVVLSGGVTPNVYPFPVTITNVISTNGLADDPTARAAAAAAQATANAALPIIGGSLTGPLVGTSASFSSVAVGTTSISQSNATGICQAASAVGFLLNGTDETTTFNSWLSFAYSNGGGCLAIDAGKTLRIDGQITFPKLASSPWTMPTIRITGAGPAIAFDDSHTTTPPPGSALDLRYAGSRFISLGLGTLKIDNLVVINGGTSCGTFFQTTLTNLQLEGDSFWGGAGTGTTSCDDVWLAGGTNPTADGLTGTIDDYFQGYGSVVRDNFAQRIRRLVYGRVAFNSIVIENNHIGGLSGSNITQSITAATNSNPVVFTSTGHNLGAGNSMPFQVTGFTGAWAALNNIGSTTNMTVIDANTFSVPVDTSTFGAMTGAPVYNTGAAIEIDGTANSGSNFLDNTNVLIGNIIEMQGYGFGVRLGVSQGNTFISTNCPDFAVQALACVWQQSGTQNNSITNAGLDSGRTQLSYLESTANGSNVFDPGITTLGGYVNQNLNVDGTTIGARQTYDVGLASGHDIYDGVGRDDGVGNSTEIGFHWVASGLSGGNYGWISIPGMPRNNPFRFYPDGTFDIPGAYRIFGNIVLPGSATGYAGGVTDVNVQMNGSAACVYPDIATYDPLGGTNCQKNTTLDSSGVKHEGGAAPTSSVGTLTGTNAGGYVVGLSGATTLTITFANGGWNSWASCTGTPGAPLATTPYVSDIGKVSVTFTFPALTGLFYYQCTGN